MTQAIKTSILTFSGIYIDLRHPDPEKINVADVAHSLSNLCRFSGHTRFHYSVAQHSVMVSGSLPAHLALQGLLHDAAEAFLGDVVSPLKRLLPNYMVLERKWEIALRSRFGLPDQLSPAVRAADLRALATERRDLMTEQADTWPVLDGVLPFEVKIEQWSPKEANYRFLSSFDRSIYALGF